MSKCQVFSAWLQKLKRKPVRFLNKCSIEVPRKHFIFSCPMQNNHQRDKPFQTLACTLAVLRMLVASTSTFQQPGNKILTTKHDSFYFSSKAIYFVDVPQKLYVRRS